MDKVRPMIASSFNEWGETPAWLASHPSMARAVTEVPIFIDALSAGLIPPFQRVGRDAGLARVSPQHGSGSY